MPSRPAPANAASSQRPHRSRITSDIALFADCSVSAPMRSLECRPRPPILPVMRYLFEPIVRRFACFTCLFPFRSLFVGHCVPDGLRLPAAVDNPGDGGQRVAASHANPPTTTLLGEGQRRDAQRGSRITGTDRRLKRFRPLESGRGCTTSTLSARRECLTRGAPAHIGTYALGLWTVPSHGLPAKGPSDTPSPRGPPSDGLLSTGSRTHGLPDPGYGGPVPALCPLCALDEYTSAQKTGDGIKYVVCSNPSHGTDGFVWEPTQPRAESHRGDGLGASDLYVSSHLCAA